MDRDEALSILKNGVEEWNRERGLIEEVDLEDLMEEDLYFDLSEIDLSRADLAGAFFHDVDFSNADLGGSNLTGAILTRAQLGRTNLQRARLRRADLSEASVFEADLQEVDCSDANLHGAVIAKCKLSRATLRGAVLNNASVSESDLRESNLAKSTLTKITLNDVNMSGVSLEDVAAVGATLNRVNLRRADLKAATLTNATFTDSDLRGADFTGADLANAQIIRCQMDGAKFDNALVQDLLIKDPRGLPTPPTLLRLESEDLLGHDAKSFFSYPAVVEVYVTRKLTPQELGIYYVHIGEMQTLQVADGVSYLGQRHEADGTVLRFQASSQSEIYRALPDLLAPFRQSQAIDWNKTIAAAKSRDPESQIKTLITAGDGNIEWQMAKRMADVFESFRNARVHWIKDGDSRGLRLEVYTDEKMAEQLSAIGSRQPLTLTFTGDNARPVLGHDRSINVGGDANESVLSSGDDNQTRMGAQENADPTTGG